MAHDRGYTRLPTAEIDTLAVATSIPLPGGAAAVAGDSTIGGNLIFTAATAKLIPGATSFTLRNNADSADNLKVTDAGVVTVRSSLVLAPANSKIVPGATSLSLRNNADSADNLLIADNGGVTLRGNVTMADAKNIVVNATTGTKIGTAASQKLGFFNATPVVQRTKAGHNNWAAFTDVVTALVELGLFDAA